ncbi:MAG: efflux RND transporter periplasmic adaptor subunit [Pseudomonadota bacterium]
MRLQHFVIASCLIGALIPTTIMAASAQGRPAQVITDTVRVEQIAETVPVFGELIAGRESRVAARIAGIVETVSVEVGDVVVEGDLLAIVDRELIEIEVAQSEAEVAVAEASAQTARIRAENAKAIYDRAVDLRANSIISEAIYDERKSAFAVAEGARGEAEARVASAKVALRRVQFDLSNAAVRAPFDGVVVDFAAEIGQFVASGSEVARILDIDGIEIEANVPARFVDALQPDSEIAALTDVGGAMVVKMRASLPTEFSATRTRPVIFEVVEKQGTAAAGQSVTLNIPVSAPREVLAVPKDALVQARGGWQVFVAEEGKASPRTVEIGNALGEHYEVLSGLQAGDDVVVRGNERLRPGQDIMPQPIQGAGASGGNPQAGQQAVSNTQD